MEFADLDAYLDAAPKAGLEHAALQVTVVAAYMHVTPPAVKLMLKSGALERIVLAGAEYVQAESLRAWRAAFEADLAKARKVLAKAARKETPIAYSDLLAKLGRDYANPGDRRRIGRLMTALGAQSLARDGVLLPAMAVAKQTGLPRHGVWEAAEAQGWYTPGQDDPELFLVRHRKKLAKTYAK